MSTPLQFRQHKIERLISEADKASMRLRNDPASEQRISEYQQAKAELQQTMAELREALESVLAGSELNTPDFSNQS